MPERFQQERKVDVDKHTRKSSTRQRSRIETRAITVVN